MEYEKNYEIKVLLRKRTREGQDGEEVATDDIWTSKEDSSGGKRGGSTIVMMRQWMDREWHNRELVRDLNDSLSGHGSRYLDWADRISTGASIFGPGQLLLLQIIQKNTQRYSKNITGGNCNYRWHSCNLAPCYTLLSPSLV